MITQKVLFIGDRSFWSRLASDHLQCIFAEVESVFWDYGERYPENIDKWRGHHIFCFKADLILSEQLLSYASGLKINFHPSTPKFRGVGAYYYVLHQEHYSFGVTVHHMVTKVDAGKIIKVKNFPIYHRETPESLSDRTAAYLLILFYEIIHLIRSGNELPTSKEDWGQILYTRKMLNTFLHNENKSLEEVTK